MQEVNNMNIYKKIFFISISLMSIVFVGLYTMQLYQKYKKQRDLEYYYSKELENIYTTGYSVDLDGHLAWTQSYFEKTLKNIEGQMLKEGFNRSQIEKMKIDGLKKGQEARRLWDEQYRKNEK